MIGSYGLKHPHVFDGSTFSGGETKVDINHILEFEWNIEMVMMMVIMMIMSLGS